MMKLIAAAALLLPITAAAETPPSSTVRPVKPQSVQVPVNPERAQMPNLLDNGGPGCPSILRQVQGEDRPLVGTRLDRQPGAHLLLAVDRHVEGCRKVTFLRRNAAPGSVMPNVGLGRD